MSPAFMLLGRESHLHERTPFRPLGLAYQRHVRFMREPVALAGVTPDAGANNILRCRYPAAISRQNVIQIQLVPCENVAAVLAGILVALEDAVPGKLHFLFRQPIDE